MISTFTHSISKIIGFVALTFGRNKDKKEEVLDPKQEQASSPILSKKEKSIPQLSKQEIELLLLMIKETSFKGEHIELVYNLVLKLQKQYKDL